MDFGLNNMDVLLQLSDGIFIVVNRKDNKIIVSYDRPKKICDECSYKEFDSIFFDSVDFKMDDGAKENFRYLISVSSESNPTSIFVERNDGTRSRFQIKQTKKGDLMFIYLENLSHKTEFFDKIDSLTGVYDKQAIMDIIKEVFEDPNHQPFSMFIIDIDDFKYVNDSYGHMFGDDVLQTFATTLKRVFNKSIIGRIGGDEFLVIDYGPTDYESVWQRCHDLLIEMRKVNELLFKESINVDTLCGNNCNDGLKLSYTLGCSRYGIDGTDYNTLFSKADKALYRGKIKGKNCFIIYLNDKHKNIDVSSRRLTNDFALDAKNYGMIMKTILKTLMIESSDVENIKEVLKIIGQSLNLDRIRVSRKVNDTYQAYCGYRKSKDPIYDYYPETFKDLSMWDDYVSEGFSSLSLIDCTKKTPELYSFLKRQNTKSVIRSELKFNGQVIGEVRYETIIEERNWTKEEEQFLKNIGNVLSLYLYRSNETEELLMNISKDNVTGLKNYPTFIKESSLMMRTEPDVYCFMFFNIINFKYFNDLYGYKLGNYYLRSFAQVLKQELPNVMFSRIGADHFVGFSKFDKSLNPNEIFKKISDALNIKISKVAHDYYTAFSVGLYLSDGTENDSPACIDNAKIAEEAIVVSNGFGYKKFDLSLLASYEEEKEIEQHFSRAIDDNEFEIFLQPKIDIKTGKLVGAEALSRWKFKHDHYLMPGKYISILEKNGTITQLDFYVFKNVCIYIKELMDKRIELFPISVNLSKSVGNFNFYLENIEKIRKDYDIDPKWIEIEITESMFSLDNDSVTKLVKRLKEIGYNVSMDDFGSGYSNLDLLGKENFDILKLDKSLISHIENEKKRIILSYIIKLANELKLQIICEGVEKQIEAEVLVNLGCTKAQGYLYDRPIPTDEFMEKYIENKIIN